MPPGGERQQLLPLRPALGEDLFSLSLEMKNDNTCLLAISQETSVPSPTPCHAHERPLSLHAALSRLLWREKIAKGTETQTKELAA